MAELKLTAALVKWLADCPVEGAVRMHPQAWAAIAELGVPVTGSAVRIALPMAHADELLPGHQLLDYVHFSADRLGKHDLLQDAQSYVNSFSFGDLDRHGNGVAEVVVMVAGRGK